MYAEDWDTGQLAGNEIIRQAFQDAGFDNILMDAKSAFPNMPNINHGTTHIITSNPANVRSVNARFDPSQINSRNVLAGAAGLAALPALPYILPQQDEQGF